MSTLPEKKIVMIYDDDTRQTGIAVIAYTNKEAVQYIKQTYDVLGRARAKYCVTLPNSQDTALTLPKGIIDLTLGTKLGLYKNTKQSEEFNKQLLTRIEQINNLTGEHDE